MIVIRRDHLNAETGEWLCRLMMMLRRTTTESNKSLTRAVATSVVVNVIGNIHFFNSATTDCEL